MTYRKIGGLHWFAIGRLRIAFCIVKRKNGSIAPSNERTKELLASWADRHAYKQLPRANWPLNRAAHYGEAAVERALGYNLSAEDSRVHES